MGVMDALGTTGRAARKEEDIAERNMMVECKKTNASQSQATSILIGSITPPSQSQPSTTLSSGICPVPPIICPRRPGLSLSSSPQHRLFRTCSQESSISSSNFPIGTPPRSSPTRACMRNTPDAEERLRQTMSLSQSKHA